MPTCTIRSILSLASSLCLNSCSLQCSELLPTLITAAAVLESGNTNKLPARRYFSKFYFSGNTFCVLNICNLRPPGSLVAITDPPSWQHCTMVAPSENFRMMHRSSLIRSSGDFSTAVKPEEKFGYSRSEWRIKNDLSPWGEPERAAHCWFSTNLSWHKKYICPPRCTWDLYSVAASLNFPCSLIQGLMLSSNLLSFHVAKGSLLSFNLSTWSLARYLVLAAGSRDCSPHSFLHTFTVTRLVTC